jgi:hypothetical protein
MFRDLKEYQEIAKLYAEKVSKPAEVESDELVENYNENRRRLNKSRTELNKGRVEKQFGFLKAKPIVRPDGNTSVRKSGVNATNNKNSNSRAIVTTNKIRNEKPGVVPGTRVNEIGAEGGGKPSEGDFRKDFPDKPVVSNLTKQGKERTPAQIAAAKRIAAGKTIQQVKDENLQSIKNKAKLKNTDFQAMKKGDMSKDDFIKKYPNSNLAKKMKEEYTPYDYVLEYLLSSKQVATIEEANYVMTEMDAETIQSIVEVQKKTLMKEQG